MNLIELFESTKKLADWRGEGYGQNSSWNLKQVIPFVGTKTLLFQAECFGETVKGIHVVNFQFKNINFYEKENLPKDKDIKEIEYKGDKYYFEKPSLTTECTYRCSCPDANYTWGWADFKAKVWFGNPPRKYVKKTNRKPKNPDLIPGFCKHGFQLQSYLHVEGYLQ